MLIKGLNDSRDELIHTDLTIETNNNFLDSLIEDKLIEKLQYSGHNYYLRKFKR